MPTLQERARALLRGALDIHMHTAPDVRPRSVNDIEAAQQAKAAGMRAILIKCHVTSTADRAQIASKVAGFPVYGGLALNYPLGGLNIHAVQEALHMGAAEIWMPTVSAAQYMKHAGATPTFPETMPKGVSGISVLKDGRLVPEVAGILELIAKYDVALGTGHLSREEILLLVDAALAAGVKKVIITHPQAPFIDLDHATMKGLAAKGAYIEHNYVFCTRQVEKPLTPAEIAETVRAVGAERCIIASDGGQAVNPPPVQMMESFIRELLRCGISDEEIDIMARQNPARILGLS